ncbi:MAG: peptidoglycan-binding protein [Myxococcales bacterium]|nr:peptidoglycan-binding protein [Myxococcales bacterium]
MPNANDRYRTPSPLYPQPTATTFSRLTASWEELRALDRDGYRTSSAAPPSTWLVDITWDDRATHRSPGRGTTCSPFVTQAIALCLSSRDNEPYEPRLSDGRKLPFLFSQLANGVLRRGVPAYEALMQKYGLSLADNTWPRPVIFFNLGRAVEKTQLRRGDCVHIDWLNGGGHAVFVWDVHLNSRGEVDAFLYLSSNGKMAAGGSGGGIAVGGTTDGSGGFIVRETGTHGAHTYQAAQRPLFQDSEGYVEHGLWVTWDPEVAARPLSGLRCPARRRPTLVKRVLAARLHGIAGNEAPLFAMGESHPGQPALPNVDGKASDFTPIELRSSSANHDARAEGTRPLGSEDVARLQAQLHLLSRLEWIPQDPGAIDGKLGPRTRRSLAAFQRAYGLEASGEPTALSIERLARVHQSALDDPRARLFASAAEAGPQAFSGPASDDETAAMVHLYFRQGAARPGDRVSLIAHGALPAQPFSLSLCEGDSREPCPDVAPLSADPLGQRACVQIVVPMRPEGTRLYARALGLCTEVPLVIAGPRRAAATESSFSDDTGSPVPAEIEQTIAQVLLGRRPLTELATERGVARDVLLRWSVRYSDAGRQAIAEALRADPSLSVTGGRAAASFASREPDGDAAPAGTGRAESIRDGSEPAQTLVLSDLHLGNGGAYDCYAGGLELCRLIEREALSRPTRLICNGDTLDFLLNEDPLCLDRGRAVQQAQAALARPENAAIFAAFGALLARGGELLIRMGNHDVELALPEVQAVLRAALRQPERVASRLRFASGEDPEQTGGLISVGGARIVITHGEQDDRWNQLDYGRLHQALHAAQGPSAFEYPPGSRLVKKLLNPLKARYGMRFADLLKPDFQGATLTALAVNPGAVRTIWDRSTLTMLWQLQGRRGMGTTFASSDDAAELTEQAAAQALGSLDERGLSARIVAAGLDIAETQALQRLLDLGAGRSFSDEETSDPEGRSTVSLQDSARLKLLRAGLSVYAAGQKRVAGRQGERFFGLTPDAAEWSEAQRLARRYGAGAVLFGHTHAARFFADPELVYVNTGTWIWLMQLPPADADTAVWTRFLDALRRDPGLQASPASDDPAAPRLLRRLHVARLLPQPNGGARLALCEWLPESGLLVLRESQVPARAPAASPTSAVRGAHEPSP